MSWKQEIEAQIADLEGRNILHGPLRSWTTEECLRKADTMQALLDVAVAAKPVVARWSHTEHQEWRRLEDAIDKLRRVSDG